MTPSSFPRSGASADTRANHVYPTFQFVDGAVLPGLPEVLELTVGKVDDWTLASWLVARQPSLGQSVTEHLRGTGIVPEVLSVARHSAERWSR